MVRMTWPSSSRCVTLVALTLVTPTWKAVTQRTASAGFIRMIGAETGPHLIEIFVYLRLNSVDVTKFLILCPSRDFQGPLQNLTNGNQLIPGDNEILEVLWMRHSIPCAEGDDELLG